MRYTLSILAAAVQLVAADCLAPPPPVRAPRAHRREVPGAAITETLTVRHFTTITIPVPAHQDYLSTSRNALLPLSASSSSTSPQYQQSTFVTKTSSQHLAPTTESTTSTSPAVPSADPHEAVTHTSHLPQAPQVPQVSQIPLVSQIPPAPETTQVVQTPPDSPAPQTPQSSQPSNNGSLPAYSNDGVRCQNPLPSYQPPSEEFPDGVYDCFHFPADQPGVVSVDYLNLGGWTGIQNTGPAGGMFDKCQEGGLCSYACQPGMSKVQWPEHQPPNGESRGGLLCKNGKLYRTNPKEANLCKWGVASAFVRSNLKQNIAFCATDYPGSENMAVPVNVQPHGQEYLSVVDGNTYYKWLGKMTSTQYYVNRPGLSVDQACRWGTNSDGNGNYSPLNVGVGYSGGMTWASIFPNPNSKEVMNIKISIRADKDSIVNGECTYDNGRFSGNGNGCTVAVVSGRAVFEITEN